ncbi:MAG: AAA family ATPase [Spirochaetia bacterium]|nr:AAA family ATPase [Spirochaetia bacterium]
MNELLEKTLAYVPDRILIQLIKSNELSIQRVEQLIGAVLFLDMVGFTSLTEEFVKNSKTLIRNEEVLKETLTDCYNHILSVMRKYGGYTYQFAGDSVMIGMVCETNEDLQMCAIRAGKCALETQEKIIALNKSKQDVNDIKIEIKISVAIGNYYQIALGSADKLINSTIIGSTVDEAVCGEKQASGGDVIVSKTLWQTLPESKTGSSVNLTESLCGQYFKLTSLTSKNHIVFDSSIFDMKNLEERIYKTSSKLIPHVLYKKIMGSHENSIGDFRDVTTLFVGFSQDDSREIKERVNIANRFFEYIYQTSLAYGGTIVQMDFTDKGNVFLILFGAPQGLENKEILAARFALKLQSDENIFPDIIRIRMGIATGKSYCGDLGAVFRKGYTVVSRSVNLAVRLMTYEVMSKDKTVICIDSNTLKHLSSDFMTAFIESCSLKGIKNLIKIYRLIKENEIKKDLYSLKSIPIIGRVNELQALKENLNQAINGNAAVTSISGETGVGKSRLVIEFIDSIKDNNTQVFVSDSYSYERFSSYFSWKEILLQMLNVNEQDNDGLKIEQIESVINTLDNVDVQWVRTLARLIGINTEESLLTKNLEINQKKERIFQIILNLIKLRSKDSPIILVFEDMHWIDDASLELLEYIIQSLNSSCVMIILVYRPNEEIENVIKKINHSQQFQHISLSELDEKDAITLIKKSLNLTEENEDLEKQIFLSSQGNPFFIESIVYNLIDKKILVKNEELKNNLTTTHFEIKLSNKLNDVILARIDRLCEKEQLILKSASVIGQVFNIKQLQKLISSIDNNTIIHHIYALQKSDLISIETEVPLTYIFRHNVICDVAYNSMLISTRRNLHLQLAEIIEEENVYNLTRVSGNLTYHFFEGENYDKAYFYALSAARWAVENFANYDAIHYYEEALKILDVNLNIDDKNEQKFQIKEEMAGICRLAGELEIARYLYAECINFHETPLKQAKLYIGLGQIFQEQGDYISAIKYMERALNMLGTHTPDGKLSTIMALLWQIVVRGIHKYLPITIRKIKKNTEKYELRSKIFVVLAKIYFFKNVESSAWCAFSYANLAERTESKYDLCIAYSNYATMLDAIGFQKASVKYFERSMEIVKTSNFQYVEGVILQRYGLHGLYTNDPDFTVSCEQRSIHVFKQIGELWEVLSSLIISTIAKTFIGNLHHALNDLHELKKISNNVNAKMQIGWAFCQIPYNEYLLGLKEYSEIKEDLDQALLLAIETGDLSGTSNTYALMGNVLTLEGFHDKAIEAAEKSYIEILKYKIKLPNIIYCLVIICETTYFAIESESFLEKKRALKLFLRSYKALKSNAKKLNYLYGPSLRIKALLLKLRNDHKQAQIEIALALKHLKTTPNLLEYARALMNAGMIYADENYVLEAKLVFEQCKVKRYHKKN